MNVTAKWNSHEEKKKYYGLNSLSSETDSIMKCTAKGITTEGFALPVPGPSKHYWGEGKKL